MGGLLKKGGMGGVGRGRAIEERWDGRGQFNAGAAPVVLRQLGGWEEVGSQGAGRDCE